MYVVNEIFNSVQGEGVKAGVWSTFIRLQGCPVGCKWCDSVRTWGPGTKTANYWLGYIASWYMGSDNPLPKWVPITVEVIEHSQHDYDRGRVAGWFDATDMHLDREVLALLEQNGFDVAIHDHKMWPQDMQFFLDYYQPSNESLWGGLTPKLSGTKMSAEQIAEQVKAKHVVITGGEPILWNLDELMLAIGDDHTIQIETSGLNDFKGMITPNWVTWSPKQNLLWDAPSRFKFLVDEVKWVVDDALTPRMIIDTMEWFSNHARRPKYVLMPEGCPPSKVAIQKVFDLLTAIPETVFGPRLQYYLGVR